MKSTKVDTRLISNLCPQIEGEEKWKFWSMEKRIVDRAFTIRGGRIYKDYSMTIRRNVGGVDYVVVEAEDGFDFNRLNYSTALTTEKERLFKIVGDSFQGDGGICCDFRMDSVPYLFFEYIGDDYDEGD